MKFYRIIILSLLTILIASCSFFTTSIAKGAARDNADRYDKLSASDLLELSSSSQVINDQKESAKILEALGRKNNLTLLSGEQKNMVLDLMIGSTITSDSLADAMKIIKNLENDKELVTFFDDLLTVVSDADTKAVVSLFNDGTSFDQMDPLSSCLTSMCILAQAAKDEGSGKTFKDFQSVFVDVYTNSTPSDLDTPEKIEQTISKAIASNSNISEKSKDSVTAALNCAIYFKTNPARAKEIAIGNMTVDNLFDSFGKAE
ncbi:MAG: hypothetical protein KBT21_06385 [Treponema sp.]|nr:hypothetical protein [Candidatus Treponema merdequi]